jgi:hypothetical protein
MGRQNSKEYIKAWQTANKDRIKKYRRNGDYKKKFGISLDEYNQILESQDGLCAICNQPETQQCYKTGVPYNLAVDHDHKTGKIRQLLCSRCNRALGIVDDNTELLLKMIDYITTHKST